MKKIVRIMGTLIIAAFLTNSKGYIIYAAEENKNVEQAAQTSGAVPDKLSVFKRNGNESYYFDAARYASDYPDLYAVFGNDKSALWNHYKTYGIAEGRIVYGTTDEVNAKLRVFDVAASITNDSMNDREKIRAVHDWIVNNTVYDYQNYLHDSIPDISYEMEGVMLRGTSGGHAWNRVWVDENWAYVDCTWDDPVCSTGNVLRHDYFLISYEDISRNHTLHRAYVLF